MRLAILARSQWANPGTANAYQGIALTFEWRHCISSAQHFFALGLNAQSDGSTLGGLSNQQFLPTAAYHQYLGRDWFIAVGGSLGLLHYALQGDDLRFNAQYLGGYFDAARDDREDLDENGRLVADMSGGFQVYNNRQNIAVGFAWLHLNQPTYSLLDEKNKLGISFVSHGTITLPFPSEYRANKSGVAAKWLLRRQSFSGRNSQQWTLLVGPMGKWAFSEYGSAQFGVYLRCGSRAGKQGAVTINAVLPTATYQSRNWSVSLTYDANMSGLRTQFAGGMEVWLSHNFGNYDKCINCKVGR